MSTIFFPPLSSQTSEGIPLVTGREFFRDRKKLDSAEEKTWNLSFPSLLHLSLGMFEAIIDPWLSAPVLRSLLVTTGDKVELDKNLMAVNVPYPFWLDEIFLVAVKRDDGTVEFYSLGA